MKLSEAIRKGARQYPKTTGTLHEYYDGEHMVCSLGAAYVGAFGELSPLHQDGPSYERLKERFPELNEFHPEPEAISGTAQLMEMVWMRNDSAGMTREAIADWLESLGY